MQSMVASVLVGLHHGLGIFEFLFLGYCAQFNQRLNFVNLELQIGFTISRSVMQQAVDSNFLPGSCTRHQWSRGPGAHGRTNPWRHSCTIGAIGTVLKWLVNIARLCCRTTFMVSMVPYIHYSQNLKSSDT
eukprot:462778-Amphidinium_carterae.1